MKRSKRLSRFRREAILHCTRLGCLIALEETTLTGTAENIFIFSPLDILSAKDHQLFNPLTRDTFESRQ
jgi:hypothetical protein